MRFIQQRIAMCTLAAAVVFLGPLSALAAEPADTDTWTFYLNGRFVTQDTADLESREQAGSAQSANLWRRNAAFVVAIQASNLRPVVIGAEVPRWSYSMAADKPNVDVTTQSWRAQYDVVDYTAATADVALSINDMLRYTFALKKPFGDWWYITKVTNVSPSGAGPAVKKGVQMLSVRDTLRANGFRVIWEPHAKQAVAASLFVSAAIPLGNPVSRVDGTAVTAEAAPMLIDGRLYATEDLLGKVIALNLIGKERQSR